MTLLKPKIGKNKIFKMCKGFYLMPLLRVVNMHMGIQLELNTGGGTQTGWQNEKEKCDGSSESVSTTECNSYNSEIVPLATEKRSYMLKHWFVI